MVFVIISILLFSFNNVLWKKNLQNINLFFLISYRAFFTSFIAVCMLIIYFDFSLLDFNSFLKITFGSLLGVIGLFSMLFVIKKTSLQWLGIYNLLGVVVTTIYLVIFEKVNISTSLNGIIIIISGYLLFIFFNKETNFKLSLKYHLLLFCMVLSFSFSTIIHWRNLNNAISPFFILANQELLVFLVSSLFLFYYHRNKILKSNYKSNFKNVLVMSVVIFFAILFSFIGVKKTDPLLTTVLFLASPLTTILFSFLFFKEKIILKNSIAIIIITVGAFVLHYKL